MKNKKKFFFKRIEGKMSSLKKRYELFQFKIQNQVSIANDEINNLKNYFNQIKNNILEISTQIEQIKNYNFIQKEIKIKKDKKIIFESKKSNLISEHQKKVFQITKDFQEKLDNKSKEFEKKNKNIKNKQINEENKLIETYDLKISNLEELINNFIIEISKNEFNYEIKFENETR